jgi:anti-sigma factor RsiW
MASIDFYLDNELREDELEVFNRHLDGCPSCREQLESRRLYLGRIRSFRPLYATPSALRERVEQLLEAQAAQQQKGSMLKERVRSLISILWVKPIPAFVTAGLVIAGLSMLWALSQQEARANAFVDMAVRTHEGQMSGRVLEMKTNSPTEMADWFTKKVPFHFRLPTYQESPGQSPLYKLVGGRLVTFKGHSAAYVSYQMNNQPISLLVTSGSSAMASGGEITTTKGLTFHSHQKNALQVVTWSVHNLTYALVSSVNLPARQSCVVCHANPKDRDLLGNLQ